ncbi:nuclear pore protein 84/107 [Mycena floridula]|nr:nuclear pore protein 84/107 [Mycena floridula]
MQTSDTLYKSCAQVVSVCQSIQDDLDALLHPVTGFAPRLRQLCREQIAEYEDSIDGKAIALEEINLLRLEENTWGLLQALIPIRKMDSTDSDTARELLEENPYTPTSTLAQAILKASPLLSDLLVVREWLHETATPPPHPEANTGYWKFTKHSIMQSLRSGTGNRDGLIRRMDPDAINREEGKSLSVDDTSYEKSLVQSLYGYVRAGRLEDAVELSRKAQQPWRAASMRGSLLFQWRTIANEQSDEDAMDDEDPELWKGNRNRKLWKSTCIRAALNSSLPNHERVLYAALAPSPQTSLILKAACRTWEDHLWAQISIMCEEKQTMELSRLGGSYWEGGQDAVEKGVRSVTDETREVEEDEWEKEVYMTLEGLQSVPVDEGPLADHPFHYSQLNVILNRTDKLLHMFADGLQEGLYHPSKLEYAPLCRFFAHLCLFLRMVDNPVPPMAEQTILEAYLQVLEAAGQRDLIAMYAGALGDNAVERYALFLVTLELSLDSSERRDALTKAREHGLDMERVAVATAELSIEKAFELLPAVKGPLPSIIAMQPPPSDAELFLLRSIEWTIFLDSTYLTALEQANVILRYFLASGRVQLAQKLLVLLPVELASFTEPPEHASEYVQYRSFFAIWETLDRIVECQALEASQMNRDAKQSWLQDYKRLINRAWDQIVKLLKSEWLVTDVEQTGGDQRRRELIRIRQIYIPELIIRLHVLLFTSRHRIPDNLRRVFDLVNIVADSRYKLYEDFVNEEGRRLGDYLGAVRQAILGGLEGGGADPFRIVLS